MDVVYDTVIPIIMQHQTQIDTRGEGCTWVPNPTVCVINPIQATEQEGCAILVAWITRDTPKWQSKGIHRELSAGLNMIQQWSTFSHPLLTKKNYFQSIKIRTHSLTHFFFLLKLYLVCTDRRNPVLCSLLPPASTLFLLLRTRGSSSCCWFLTAT